MFYKIQTLLLILPIMFPVELGLWLFAFKGGWWKERVKVYDYWLDPKNWKPWLEKRKKMQAMRQISDRELLANAATEILFQEQDQQHPLVTKLANPVMDFYFKKVLKPLIRW